MQKKNILLFWSGGKDSNFALTKLKQNEDYNILGLVTLINRAKNRVNFHGIPEVLLVDQAKLLSLPLIRIYIDDNSNFTDNLNLLAEKLNPFVKKNLSGIAFGDIHSEKNKSEHQSLCDLLKIEGIFPLWNLDEKTYLKEYFEANHQALVTGVDRELLNNSFLAKLYNEEWINELPTTLDKCGENGEFKTFATFSPYFKMRIPYSKTIAVEEGPYTVTLLKEP